MSNRIFAIMRKEMRHILRDPRTLLIIIVMPILMVLLFGSALNMNIEHIRIAVVDYDHTPGSHDLIERFAGSRYFDIVSFPQTTAPIEEMFTRREIKAALVIPQDFGKMRETEPVASVQLIVDGSDPTYGNAVVNYASAIANLASLESVSGVGGAPFEIRQQFLYNPDLEGSHFIIPGLLAVIMMMVCALLTSITVAREKETGTMDLVLVSPVRPIEILLGKVAPYIVLALVDAVFILVFSKIVFDIPLRGDLLLLFALSIIYIYCALGIGLFISSVAPTQQVAMMAALVATILPSILLSGFLFPIFSMPAIIRVVTYIVPARYYMEIARGILLKASPFSLLVHQTVCLVGLGTFFLLLATVIFYKRSGS